MARDEKMEALSSMWLFRSCTKKDLAAIGRAFEQVSVPAGHVLCKEGDIGREFYLILQGRALVKRNNKKVASLVDGDYFGEMALLDRGPRSATVSAETALDLLVLGQREFSALIDQIPGLGHKLLTAMATRLRETDAKLFG